MRARSKEESSIVERISWNKPHDPLKTMIMILGFLPGIIGSPIISIKIVYFFCWLRIRLRAEKGDPSKKHYRNSRKLGLWPEIEW